MHGADFGGAGDGADGEGEAEGVEDGFVGGEFAGDVGDDVHDVAVAFDGHDVVDLHAAQLGGAADVIAAQVHEHDVLGTFLGIGEEIFFEGFVFGIRRAATPRACEGAVGDDAVLDAAHDFRAAAHEDAIRARQIKHEGAGVDHAQRAVDIEGSRGGRRLQALRKNHLKNVAGLDVFLCREDGLLVLLFRRIGGERRPHLFGQVHRGHFKRDRLIECGDDAIDAGHRVGINLLVRPPIPRPACVGVGDDEDGFLDVVEDDEVVVDAEEEVGEVAVVARGVGKFFGLEVADGVVCREAHGTAGKAGERRGGGVALAFDGHEEVFEVFEGVGGGEVSSFGFRVSRLGFDGDVGAEGADDGFGVGGEEGVAGDAFAADDGFEEEGV